ncbi:sensor domain-containing protein [Methanolobus chelungpuianus]|uniref:sensor domain-containing protein n=1 Tax=Methanolobus chelungpuianus TaxID=502115 RepID=UPI00211446E2|nr:sensor domain-containing protein [Methanolobus chelungpuianus]
MFGRTGTAFSLLRRHLRDFVAVAFRKQTYLNFLYLLFTFPLGTAYFVFLVTGLSLGFHLLGIWLGIPILLLVFLAWWEMASFERQLAEWLLGVKIPPMSHTMDKPDSVLDSWVSKLRNPVSWKALLFLLLKFPLGVFSLGVSLFMIAMTVLLFLAPLIGYALVSGPHPAGFHPYSSELSMIAFFSALPVGLLSLHVINLLAGTAGKFAVLMLGVSSKEDGFADQES